MANTQPSQDFLYYMYLMSFDSWIVVLMVSILCQWHYIPSFVSMLTISMLIRLSLGSRTKIYLLSLCTSGRATWTLLMANLQRTNLYQCYSLCDSHEFLFVPWIYAFHAQLWVMALFKDDYSQYSELGINGFFSEKVNLPTFSKIASSHPNLYYMVTFFYFW